MSSRDWISFVGRRLIVLVLLLVVISFAVFSLLYISPGNIVDTLLGTNPRTPATVRFLTNEYHLNKPLRTQYWIWASQAAQQHFGNSIQTTLPVINEINEINARLPSSVFLGIYAYVLTMVFGVGLGIWAALRRRRVVDRGIVAGSIVALSTPAFVSGVFMIYLFAVVVHLFPVFGPGTGFFNELWHLTLPAIALALTSTAFVLKHTRAALMGVLDQDYVSLAVSDSVPGTTVKPVLEVDWLRIDRVRQDRTDTIVSAVSLSLKPGETIGIVGESGSGKSMTASAITGLLPPVMVASGEVRYGGRNLLGLGERQWRLVRGREVGMILQDPCTMLNPVMRCGRILGESLLPEGRMGRAQRKAESVGRLAEVGISDPTVGERYPFQLSGGMRQRVAIAAALARDPKC